MGPKFTILPFPGVAHTTYPLSSTLEPLGLKYSLSLSLFLCLSYSPSRLASWFDMQRVV